MDLAPYIFQQYFKDDGTPLNAGTITAYEAGTLNLKDTYTTAAGDTANANPFTLGADGRTTFYLENGAYDFVIKDSSGNTLDTKEDVLGGSSTGSGSTQIVESIAALKALPSGSSEYVDVAGYYLQGDNRLRHFYWAEANATADNGGTIIIPDSAPANGRWVDMESGAITLKDFGAKGDGSTDDKPSIAKAALWAASNSGDIYVSAGSYSIGSSIAFSANSRVIMSENALFTSGAGYDVTFSGVFECGLTQAFSGQTTPQFSTGSVDYVRPEWLGCFGDNVEASAEFKTALSAAVTWGVPLRLSKGTYNLTSWTSLEVSTNVTIYGEGIEHSFIVGPGNAGEDFINIHDSLTFHDFKISTFNRIVYGTIDGASTPADRVDIQRVWFNDASYGVTLEGDAADNANSGVTDILIKDCVFTSMIERGARAYYKLIDNCIIDGNRMQDFSGSGAVIGFFFGLDTVAGTRRKVSVINNFFEALYSTSTSGVETQAIMIHEAIDAYVANNYIHDLKNDDAGAEDCEGIYIRTVTRAIVTGNKLTKIRCGVDGLIDIKNNCEYAKIYDNVIDNEDYKDMDQGDGILCFASGCDIQRNSIKNVGGFGINLVDTSSTVDANITYNKIDRVGALAGIFAYCSDGSRIEHNWINDVVRNYSTNVNYGALPDSDAAGIYIISPTNSKERFSVSYNTINTNVTTSSSPAYGIRVNTGFQDSMLVNNIIENVTTGIFSDEFNSTVLGPNFISSSTADITVTTETTNSLNYLKGGIKFPATQSASTDVNTLDDYEEGTFTPTVSFGGGSTGLTYTTQSGKYTKIGRQVLFELEIQLSAKGSSTGSVLVSALPFTASSTSSGVVNVGKYQNMASITSIVGIVNNSASTFGLENDGATASADLTEANFTDTSRIWCSGSYFV